MTGKLGLDEYLEMNEEITLRLATLHWEADQPLQRNKVQCGRITATLGDRESSEEVNYMCSPVVSGPFPIHWPTVLRQGMRDGEDAGIHLRQGEMPDVRVAE